MDANKHAWLKLWVAGALLVAGVAAPLAIWRHAQAAWLDQNELLRVQAVRLAGLAAENQRLSNHVEQAKGPSLPSEPLRELLRLRGEIGLLRRFAGEVDELRAMNRRLKAVGTNSARELPAPPPDAAILARWPKAQLAFTGHADPASALQTALCAMSRGDTNLLVASVTPEAMVKITRQYWQNHGDPADEIAASARDIAGSLNPSSGFYLVGQTLSSPARAVLTVYFEGEGKTRKFALEKIGAEWKLEAMGCAGGGDDDLGAPAWP